MKTSTGLFSIAAILIAGVAQSGEIIVHVNTVPTSKGTLIATLSNSDDAWNFKAPPLQEKRVPAVKRQNGAGNSRMLRQASTRSSSTMTQTAMENSIRMSSGFRARDTADSKNANPMRRAHF